MLKLSKLCLIIFKNFYKDFISKKVTELKGMPVFASGPKILIRTYVYIYIYIYIIWCRYMYLRTYCILHWKFVLPLVQGQLPLAPTMNLSNDGTYVHSYIMTVTQRMNTGTRNFLDHVSTIIYVKSSVIRLIHVKQNLSKHSNS